ncbi:MAG TPA: CvpA family protein [Puia sp.]|nr:CvpA family protein [Puia sp.]
MLIDIIFLILMLVAVFRGMRRGLIVSVFSVAACIIGLAAAIKLSAVVADHLKDNVHIHTKWLPILAFLLVFVGVVLIVRWIANLLEEAIDVVFMDWLNKLGGMALYVVLFIAVYSILLFYGTSAHIISRNTISSSVVYHWIEPWGPAIINEIGKIIPVFKNMFADLEDFFEQVARKAR